jgi:hypothetical protein
MLSTSLRKRAKRARVACTIVAASLLCGLTAISPAMAATGAPASPAAPAGAASAAPAHARAVYQTPPQALAQAKRTGKAVPVTGATTATTTLTANPNGTLTLTEDAVPVRAEVDGTWRALNPDLVRNANGTLSPAVSTSPLALSGGGSSPLATMTDGPYALSVYAPMRLPVPTVSGATATYAGVLPGVDLIVTAEASGGYSEDLRVDSRAAAADPGLASLAFTTKARGLTLATASGGSIEARDARGEVIFAAPAPQMWDSAVNAAAVKAAVGGATATAADVAANTARAERAGLPVRSTATQPALGAHTAALGVRVNGGRMTLSPSRSLLASSAAVFPEFIDPSWMPAGDTAANWAYVSSNWPTQQYYDVKDFLQVGVDPDLGGTSYSFYSLSIPTSIRGAFIHSATAYFPEVWADSCTASPVDLYETGGISSSTTYDNQPSWGAKLGSDNVAYGWNSSDTIGGSSSCPIGAKDVSYDISSVATSDAAIKSGSFPAFNVGLKAEATTGVGWKLFADPGSAIDENASLTIQYATPPTTPTLSTSDDADCASGASVVGDGNITFIASGQDAQGIAPSVTYDIYAAGYASDPIVSKPASSAIKGTAYTATLQLTSAQLETADSHDGSDGQVVIDWTASANAGLTGLPASGTASCQFTFSTSKPGTPNVDDSATPPVDCNISTLPFAVGTPVTFTATADAGNTTPAPANPTSYTYQLNGGSPVTVPAAASSPYTGDITVTPTQVTNVLTVVAVAAGDAVGGTYSCGFTASAPAAAADQDMTGDGVQDLLTVGSGTTGSAPGLWLADGKDAGTASGSQFDGTIATNATDIAPYGPQGLGASQSSANGGTPDSWDGLKAFTGQLEGAGFNDIEAYAPGTNVVYWLPGQGDGSIAGQGASLLDVFDSTQYTDSSGDSATDFPMQLVNAYDISDLGTSSLASPYPDQMGVYTDPALGSYLAYFPNSDSDVSFDESTPNFGPWMLTNDTPDGTMDWNNWTITTDLPAGAADPDMYLWDQSTGALWLWQVTGLSDETTACGAAPVNCTATLDVTATNLGADTTAGTWNDGTALSTLQAADITGNPGVIAVTSTGQVESWELSGSTFAQVNATGSAQTLQTADHTWQLNKNSSGTAATAADTPDTPGATASGPETEYDLSQGTASEQPTWNTGDHLFSPDLSFNGTSDYMNTAAAAGVTPSDNFTISVWVNPSALGGTVLDQNGPTSYSTFKLGSTTSGTWYLSVLTSGTSYDTMDVGTARTGLWTNLVITFTASTDLYKLYANGIEVGEIYDTSPPTSSGRFGIGSQQVNGAATSFFAGQMADVQMWDSLAVPVQTTAPASAFVPINPERLMDTESAYKVGAVTGPVAAGATITVPIADEGATTLAPFSDPDITAVAVAITVVAPAGGGFLTVFPDGSDRPDTSTMNYATSVNVTNDEIVPVGPDGKIAINVNGAATQIVVDATGYFTTDLAATNASTYTPLANSSRVLLTSTGLGVAKGTVASDGTLAFHVANNSGSTGAPVTPASGATVTAVALNIGALPPSGDNGWIAAYPNGATRNEQTVVTFNGPQTSSDTVIVPVSASNGEINLYNGSPDAINIVGDLAGYFTTSTTGQYYHPINPIHVVDTRSTSTGAVPANGTIGFSTPSSLNADNASLVLNVTVAGPTDSGYLSAYPGSQSSPGTSISDFAAGSNVATDTIVNTANANNYVIGNASGSANNIIVVATGYFD